MLEELQTAIKNYLEKWAALVDQCIDKPFFERLRPVAVGWKVADREEYDRVYAELHDACDKIIETWMNERWIAKMHLKETTLRGGIEIIKLMQRRPGSEDAVGLDHVDFYSPEVAQAKDILEQEPALKWTIENNDAVEGYEWLSVWFANTEAKLKANTVIDIVTHELQELNQRIIDNKP